MVLSSPRAPRCRDRFGGSHARRRGTCGGAGHPGRDDPAARPSGFIGPAGQSPHANDQLPLFEALTFKPEPLGGGPGGGIEAPRAGVRIRRDAFGVPAISAASEDLGWWGAGYAVAQDRLGELELFRRKAGRLADEATVANGPDAGPCQRTPDAAPEPR